MSLLDFWHHHGKILFVEYFAGVDVGLSIKMIKFARFW